MDKRTWTSGPFWSKSNLLRLMKSAKFKFKKFFITSMHSSRMHTVRLLTISGGGPPTEGGSASRGVCPTWGVCLTPRGQPNPGGGLHPEGWGSASGGVCPPRGGLHPWGSASKGGVCPTPGGSAHPLCEQNDWQTGVKTLPCRNFVAGGKNIRNTWPGIPLYTTNGWYFLWNRTSNVCSRKLGKCTWEK